ncbi:MAG: hypothetical protein EBS17_02465 [Flavobacteriia bacterium]|nr:hypothetical protein [Flavobacteriia bacterium]
MKTSPYQDLFIQQDQVQGISASNCLVGVATIQNADWQKLSTAIQTLLTVRKWPTLKLNSACNMWEFSETLSGTIALDTSTSHELNLARLWSINLYREKDHILLKLCMHHALADAHSFQLFWEDIKTVYEGKELQANENDVPIIDTTPALDLGPIREIPSLGLGPVERISIEIPPNRKRELLEGSAQKKVNLSTFLLGYLQHALAQIEPYLGVPIQTGIALRNRTGRREKAQFLTKVNFLPTAHLPLKNLQELEKHIKHCFRNQGFPLLKWLAQEKRNTAFNVLFSYQKENFIPPTSTIQATFSFLPSTMDENLLSLHVLEYGDAHLTASFDVRTDLADRSFWRSFVCAFMKGLLHELNNEPFAFNFPKALLRKEKQPSIPLWKGFDAAAPEKIAVICGEEQMSFQSLRNKLTEPHEAYPDMLSLKPIRAIDTVVQILRQWYAGRMVTFTTSTPSFYPTGDYLYLAETSGSTGNPKQVLISKTGIEELLHAWEQHYQVDQESVHLSLADMRFDVFFGDLFRSIFLGSTLVLATEEERLSPTTIELLIKKHRVTHLESTPSFLQIVFKENTTFFTLKHLICGSEKMTASLYSVFSRFKALTVYNSYGLTEVSIDSAVHPLYQYGEFYPLGFPMGSQQFSVHSATGEPLPFGIWGELYITGNAVGTPLLPSESYTTTSEGTLVYKTGDRALLHPQHGLIISGRLADDFIKVNGRRIPLNQIEKAVSQLEELSYCCLIAIDGYCVLLHNLKRNNEEIQDYLKGKFPRYQLPDVIQFNSHWPLNRNGKIDRKALIPLIQRPSGQTIRWVPSSDPRERMIMQVLNSFDKPFGGVSESLVMYGWNSIDLLSLCNELTLKGISVNPHKLMGNPSIQHILEVPTASPTEGSSHEVKLDDLDLDELIGILNQ